MKIGKTLRNVVLGLSLLLLPAKSSAQEDMIMTKKYGTYNGHQVEVYMAGYKIDKENDKLKEIIIRDKKGRESFVAWPDSNGRFYRLAAAERGPLKGDLKNYEKSDSLKKIFNYVWSNPDSTEVREWKSTDNFEVRKGEADFKKKKNLERKIPIFIILSLGGIAISFNSLNTTGFAISNFIQTTPVLIGLLLFIVGLVGLFLALKR